MARELGKSLLVARHDDDDDDDKVYYSTLLGLYWPMSRVFANAPGEHGSIPGHVIPKAQKWYLIVLA